MRQNALPATPPIGVRSHGNDGTVPMNPAEMTDSQLLIEYELSDGDDDNPRIRALLAEIERRGLDV